MKKIVLIFFFIFALNGCNSSSLNIVLEDSQKILPKSDFDIISGITTVHYKFYVLISNDYSLDQDFTQEANNYVDKNVIKNENNIIYFISLENRMISIQATNTVAQIISQEQFTKAIEKAIEKFKTELFGEGIFDSIKYLDSIY